MVKMQKQILNFQKAIPKNLSQDKLNFLTENSSVICSEYTDSVLVELRQILGAEKYFVVFSNHSTADGQYTGIGREMHGEWIDGTIYMPVTNFLPGAIKDYAACNCWIAKKHCVRFFEEKIKSLEEQLAKYKTGGDE